MKKFVFLFFLINIALFCFAGETVWVYESNGVRTAHDLSMIDSLSFVTPKCVSLSPSEKNLPSTGGRFSLNINTDGPWTATVSDPTALILSKTSGKGNETINVSAFANTDNKPYTETVTVELNDGTKAHLKVNVSVDDEYVYSDIPDPYWPPFVSKIIEKQGGTFETQVSSNTYWTARCSESWVHISPSSGKYDGKVKVTVDSNKDADDKYATIYFEAMGGTSISRSIVCGDRISVSPTTKKIRFEGGSFDVAVTSNTEWTASSNKSWASVSIEQGTGDALFVINVASGVDKAKADTAIVTCTTTLGKSAAVTIYRAEYTGAGENVTDINGSSYSTVWIGGQNWMAENLRCDKYDTESEAYNASWLTDNTIPTSEWYTDTPYYTDASDKSKWDKDYDYYDNLTDAQVKKLGYLYNWAAAVGVADGYDYGTKPFSGNRQGICPNGWHVPSRAEWQTLYDYIYSDKSLTSNEVGKYLKTTSGWYDEGEPEEYPQGLDSYGFAALPAGHGYGSSVSSVGGITFFWTATPDEVHSYSAYTRHLDYDNDYLDGCGDYKGYGQSVRCLKD
ncbi:MAG: hypothetical protein MJ007_02480 [Paludibacteraceae bacterium]|nr:hypothetical protein [Paludibacteraceae bacterium]